MASGTIYNLLALFILISCTPARSRDACSPTASPNGTRAARIGEQVIMECGADKTQGLDKIEWRFNNKRLNPSLHYIMNTTSLTLNSTQWKDTGNYMCLRNDTPAFAVRLIVQQVPKTPTLSCFVKSYLSPIRCQWRSEELNRLTKCTLSFRTSLQRAVSQRGCRVYTGRRVCVCLLPHREGEYSYMFMTLTISNSVGCAASKERAFTLDDLLKPDPPESVRVKQVLRDARKLMVSWSYPQTWQTGFYALKFELTYGTQNTDSLYNKVHLQETRFQITDALPDVNYTVRVRAKEEFDHGTWSNWSEPAYGMPWADPERNKIPEEDTEGMSSGITECEDCDWEETTPQGSQSQQWGGFPWYGLLLLMVSLVVVVSLFAVMVIRYRKKWKGQSAGKGTGGHPPEYLPVRLLTLAEGDGALKAETIRQCGLPTESRPGAFDLQPHFDVINMSYFYLPQS